MRKVLFTTDSAENLHSLWKSFIYAPPENYCYYDLKGEVISRDTQEPTAVMENTEKSFLSQVKPLYRKSVKFASRNSFMNQIAKELSSRIVSKKIDRLSPDIVYAVNGRLIKSQIPWVIDAENVGAFTLGYNYKALHSERYKRYIEQRLSSEYCKKILPYSIFSKNSMLATLNCENFIHKIEVVPCAVEYKERLNKIPHDTFNILFTGTSNALPGGMEFYYRGGREVIMSFLRLREKFPRMRLIFRMPIPEEVKRVIKSTENIEIHENILPREKFEELFLRSDVYLLPAFGGFGVSIIEAMSYGLPVITTDFDENQEYIENSHNGFKIPLRNNLPRHKIPYVSALLKPILDEQFIDDICGKIQYLYENESERIRMGENSRKMVRDRFSLEVKNRSLKKIYDDILTQTKMYHLG